MDNKPHTHRPELRQRYGDNIGGPWELTYGDTTIRVCPEYNAFFKGKRTPSEKEIQRALVKAVKQHDAGSRRDVDRVTLNAALVARFPVVPADKWASEVLK